MSKISIVIVNKNCLSFTKDCIRDLKKQDCKDFDIHLIDNNSDEIGTRSFFMKSGAKTVYNDHNRPLNHIWNEYIKNTKTPYVCFLNNDVRIPSNFVSDTIKIFEKEPKVGVVNHPSNHPSFLIATPGKLSYEIVDQPYRQGWDFSFRKEAYVEIPSQIHFFCGDDFLYENLYKNWKGAFATSSPMIHFQGKTRSVRRNSGKDIREYKALGYRHHLKTCKQYSKDRPTAGMVIREEK
jgi:glycosyltransferase involved in cell wall biosynthesis